MVEVDGEVSVGVEEEVGGLEEEDTTTIDKRISMRMMDDFVSLIFSPFFYKMCTKLKMNNARHVHHTN